jgi:hypothetical protein
MKYALLFLTLLATQLNGQEIRYTQKDSTKICHMLAQLEKSGSTKTSQLLVDAGTLLLGTPYVAGTLDREKDESLTINISEVDCTTFVEQSLALAMTIAQGKKDFRSFCDNLRTLRYRDGTCRNYSDRLHYFSQWVKEGEKNGILKELSGKEFSSHQSLSLSFMSKNPDKYMQLKDDSTLTASIATHERPFRNLTIPYLPKEKLNNSRKQLPIRNGDIIALVTNIKGLDVTHMGIAYWKRGKLHLMHASYKEKRVIKDPLTLHDYLAPRKSAPGIRVVRVK